MEELKNKFHGCSLNTEKIRETIKKILKVDDSTFFCYKCFALIGPYNKCLFCKKCYQPYCFACGKTILKPGTYYIEVSKCFQCIENDKKLPLLYPHPELEEKEEEQEED